MPKQWKFITLYMLLAYLVFIGVIMYAKRSVEAENAPASHSAQKE